MGILSRFRDIMASNVNAIFKKNGDVDEKKLKKYLDSVRSDMGQLKAEAEAIRDNERRAAASYSEKLAEIDKFRRYADEAEASGNAGDAAQYRLRADTLEREAAPLKDKYDAASEDSVKVEQLTSKLESDIAELEAKVGIIKSQNAVASGESYAEPLGDVNARLDALNKKADEYVDLANARAELSGDPRQDIIDLTKKYDE